MQQGVYKADPRNESEVGYLSTCVDCKTVSKRLRHCTRCKVCFEQIDHHCPWMNKCVARGNIGPFYAFICITFSGLFYAFGLAVS